MKCIFSTTRWRVRLGAKNLSRTRREEIERAVEDIFVHPEFDGSSSYFDVAVLLLEGDPIVFTGNFAPFA